jgi:3-phenylpropionate/trans-cinnamate dioxygenase ferredoxin reductase subunit
VRLADGRDIAADTVLISIGAAPNDQLAQDIGCACNDGIIVDISGRTSHAGVYAIGDVTRRPLPVYGSRMMRMESVPSALEQARLLAHHLTGRADPPAEVPWFWSDQYDLKLQIAGMPVDVARTVTRGHPADKRFAVYHLDSDNRVQSVEAINMPAEFMFGRRLIGNRKPVDPDKLVDPAVPIRDVIA